QGRRKHTQTKREHALKCPRLRRGTVNNMPPDQARAKAWDYRRLARAKPEALTALAILQSRILYELSSIGTSAPAQLTLHDVYVRGVAYLVVHRGSEATAEFQKILDHRGIVWNSPIGALADLQMGRANAMHGDTVKAKVAYRDFLALWKDADPDIPILKQ